MCLKLTPGDVLSCEEAQEVWQGELRSVFDEQCDFSQEISADDLEEIAPRNPFTGRWHAYMLFNKTTPELVELYSQLGSYRRQVETSGRTEQDRYYRRVKAYQERVWETLYFRAFMTPGEFEGIEQLQQSPNYNLCRMRYEIILEKLYLRYSIPMIWVLDAFAEGEEIDNQTLEDIGMLRFRTEANHRNLVRKYKSLPIELRSILPDFHLYDLFWHVQSFRELGNDYGRVFQSLNQRIGELNGMKGGVGLVMVDLDSRPPDMDGAPDAPSTIADALAFELWQITDSEIDTLLTVLNDEDFFSQLRRFVETEFNAANRDGFLVLLDALEGQFWDDAARLQTLLNRTTRDINRLKADFSRFLTEFIRAYRGGIFNEG